METKKPKCDGALKVLLTICFVVSLSSCDSIYDIPDCVTKETIDDQYAGLIDQVLTLVESRQHLMAKPISLQSGDGMDLPEFILELNLYSRNRIDRLRERLGEKRYQELMRVLRGDPIAAEFGANIEDRPRALQLLYHTKLEGVMHRSFASNATRHTWNSWITRGTVSDRSVIVPGWHPKDISVLKYEKYMPEQDRILKLTMVFEYHRFIESLASCSNIAAG